MKVKEGTISLDIQVNEWEKKVVKMLADGLLVPDISDQMKTEYREVEYRISKLKSRLQCKTSNQLVYLFTKNKLID